LKEEVNNEINKLNEEKESSHSINSKNLESPYEVNNDQNFQNKNQLNTLRDPIQLGELLEKHENLTDFDMNNDKYTKNFHFDEYIFTNEIPYENTVLPTNSFPRFELRNNRAKKFPKKENRQYDHEQNYIDSYKYNHTEIINEDIIYPINPKKAHEIEPEVNKSKKFSQKLNFDSNKKTLIKNYESVNHHNHKKSQEKPQINIKPKSVSQEEDFFFQIFRNVSSQKKKLQIFTEKIYNISKRNRVVGREIKQNSERKDVKMPINITNNPIKTSILIESEKDNNILEQIKNLKREIIQDSKRDNVNNTEILRDENEKRFKLDELANTDYDLNKRDDQEKYVNSIRKNIKNFIIKKSEFRQNREDALVELDYKFNDLIKNRRNNDDHFYNKSENIEKKRENEDDKIISEISDGRKSIQDIEMDHQSKPQEEEIENEGQIELNYPNENINENEIDNDKQVENVSDYIEKSIDNKEIEILEDINSR